MFTLKERILKSVLVRLGALLLFALGSLGFGFFVLTGLGTVFLSTFFFYNKKKIYFESLLTMDLFREKIGRIRPWDPVDTDERVILGRLPLLNRDDLRALARNKVDVVIAILEPFEEITVGAAFEPVPKEHFLELGIYRERLLFPDLTRLELPIVEKGVALIQKYVKQGKKVYVHCKSGQGRSACLAAAYLLAERCADEEPKKQVAGVIERMRKKRPQISLNRQLPVLHAFAERFRS